MGNKSVDTGIGLERRESDHTGVFWGSSFHAESNLRGDKTCLAYHISGIRSLDETRRLYQSETVKVARAVKQKYKKLGAPPPRPRNNCCPLPYFIKNEP